MEACSKNLLLRRNENIRGRKGETYRGKGGEREKEILSLKKWEREGERYENGGVEEEDRGDNYMG